MTPDPLTPRPAEGDVLRLFSSDAEPEPGAIPGTDPARTVVLRLSDLGGMSLGGYVSEGFDAPDEELMRVDAELRAAEGWVLIVPASALPPEGAPLEPPGGIRPLAAIRLDRTPAPAAALGSDEGAAPPPAAPAARPPLPGPGGRRTTLLVLAALVLAALVLLALALG